MFSLLQLYQHPVISNQNLISVSSTWAHNFSHGTNMPTPSCPSWGNAVPPGEKKVLLAALSFFYWRRGALVSGGIHERAGFVAAWLGMLGESKATIILEVCWASFISREPLFYGQH